MDFDLIFMRLALPFGWSASPGYFQACARLITALHCLHKPVSPSTGALAFPSHMSVGDAVIIEVDLPGMLEQSARVWGQCCIAVLDSWSVSDKKKEAECTWEEEHILLGSHVNVGSKSIKLPDANTEGASLVFRKPDCDHGNTVIF